MRRKKCCTPLAARSNDEGCWSACGQLFLLADSLAPLFSTNISSTNGSMVGSTTTARLAQAVMAPYRRAYWHGKPRRQAISDIFGIQGVHCAEQAGHTINGMRILCAAEKVGSNQKASSRGIYRSSSTRHVSCGTTRHLFRPMSILLPSNNSLLVPFPHPSNNQLCSGTILFGHHVSIAASNWHPQSRHGLYNFNFALSFPRDYVHACCPHWQPLELCDASFDN
ncbi:hypothetical protein IWX49DRAFT_83685 [Phyllosticta citricarpa]|uniref:Uncharacterized protein n=2 Tax=Phyllosticta TaxID=121621 RepID=A0ABR1MS03_9PEZI